MKRLIASIVSVITATSVTSGLLGITGTNAFLISPSWMGRTKTWTISSSDATCSSSTTTNGHRTPTGRSSSISPSTTRLYYEPAKSDHPYNVWNVLATTERWIQSTLAEANANSRGTGNPWSRKEVSYVCETSTDLALILANIFRKLKEARQLGETHGQQQEELMEQRKGKVLCDDSMFVLWVRTIGVEESYMTCC